MKKFTGKTKFIFVTGGVVSGIGKGIVSASIGNILKARGFKVFIQKLDPYLNQDPGVLSPYEHGEVYVTEDGGETDLDLGHYERFIDENLTKDSNYTAGKIFQNLIYKERNGDYKGKTVQIIPHFTDEILEIIVGTAKKYNCDFLIIEIGGTVGDIESSAFMRSIAEFSSFNPAKTFSIHTTYIPFLETSKDFKTKPTQSSISLLLSLGIKPNMIVLRSHNELPIDICKKIAKFVFLDLKDVISLHDVESVYKIPLYLESVNVGQNIIKHFKLKSPEPNLNSWKAFCEKINNENKTIINVGMIGKYTEFEDAYKSIKEALFISSVYENIDLKLKWIDSNIINEKNIEKQIGQVDGIAILPGFGVRGFEGKIQVAIYAREKNIPTLGICLGMQVMTIGHARMIGYKNATSSEISKSGEFIFDLIKKDKKALGGTLRLGKSNIILKNGSKIKDIYQKELIIERHRHRYEVNKKYAKKLEVENFVFSGFDEKSGLIEVCEVTDKKFYLGTQYHPEFNARPLKPHPLFTSFLKSCK